MLTNSRLPRLSDLAPRFGDSKLTPSPSRESESEFDGELRSSIALPRSAMSKSFHEHERSNRSKRMFSLRHGVPTSDSEVQDTTPQLILRRQNDDVGLNTAPRTRAFRGVPPRDRGKVEVLSALRNDGSSLDRMTGRQDHTGPPIVAAVSCGHTFARNCLRQLFRGL